MQYKVPQKIDMEDKIIGPLTLKQFLYLMGGGMITYVLLESVSTFFFVIFGLPIAVISLFLAFVKIQDQPFAKFILSAAVYLVNPKERCWFKDYHAEKFSSELEVKDKVKAEKKIELKQVKKSQLEALAQQLDSKTWDQIQKDKTAKKIKVEEEKDDFIIEDIFNKKKL